MAITKITTSLSQSVRRLACLLVSVGMSFALLGQADSTPPKLKPSECHGCYRAIAADSFCMLYRDSLPVIVDRIQRKMGTDADFWMFARLYNTIKLNTIHVFCGPHMLGGKDYELEKLESHLKIVLEAKRPTDYYRLGHYYTMDCSGHENFVFYKPKYNKTQGKLDLNYEMTYWLSYKRSKLTSPDGKCRSIKCNAVQFHLFVRRNWLLIFRRMRQIK